MKTFLATLVLALSITIFPQHSLAQTNCSVINTEDDFAECCLPFAFPSAACNQYENNQNAGGDNQGGGPIDPGSTFGETITVSNNYGMCNSYIWNGNTWVKTNVNPIPCGPDGGPTNTCNELPPDSQEYIECMNSQGAGNGDGTILGGDLNTNTQNGGTTPSNLDSSAPQASSAALLSCNKIKFNSILDILIWLKCIIAAAVIPLVFTLAFLFFIWGVAMYIKSSDDVKKRAESQKFIYWGIIGLTVMISVWGIVKIVSGTFGFGNTVPKLQTDYLKTTP